MTLTQIQQYVENQTGLDLSNKSRERNYAYARAIYFYLCRQYTRNTTTQIGKSLGKNHATVLHAINNIIPTVLKYDKALASVCLDFKGGEVEYIDVRKRKIDLIDENVKLKTKNALLKNKIESVNSNKFLRLSYNIPEDKEEIAYKMFKDIISDISKDEHKTKVYSAYNSVDSF